MANGYYNKKGLIDPDKLQKEFASKREHVGTASSKSLFEKNLKEIQAALKNVHHGVDGYIAVGDDIDPVDYEFLMPKLTKGIKGGEDILKNLRQEMKNKTKSFSMGPDGDTIDAISETDYKKFLKQALTQYAALGKAQVESEQMKSLKEAEANILKQQGIYEQVHKQTFQDFQSKRYGQSIQDFISGIKGEQERKIFLQRQQSLITAQRQHEWEQEQLGLQEREAELKSQTLIGGRGLGGSSIESDTQAQVKSQTAEQQAQSQQRFANEFVRAEGQAQQDLMGLSGTLSREKQIQLKTRQDAKMNYEQSINLIVQQNMNSEMQRVQVEFQKQRTNLTDEINEISAKLRAFTI